MLGGISRVTTKHKILKEKKSKRKTVTLINDKLEKNRIQWYGHIQRQWSKKWNGISERCEGKGRSKKILSM